jgi:formamidase
MRFDARTALRDLPGTGHNRWHPAIPPLLHVAPGATLELDLRDGMDGQVPPAAAGATLALDLGRGHPLTGPIAVAGAQPGDLLEVEIVAIEPAPEGFTVVLPEHCLLAHRRLERFVVHWSIAGGLARSPQLPGVAIPDASFLGCLGVAPSHERLRQIVARERALAHELGIALPGPSAGGAIPAREPVASEGLHTVPPREHGGNADVREWRPGTRVLLPVEVPGALLSVGDAHFAQGDGECAGSALEMRAVARLRIGLRRGAAARLGLTAPAFERPAGTVARAERPVFATTGISVDRDGRNRHLDVRTAAIAALDQLVDWIVATRGWRAEQALALASVAVHLRIGSLVNTPNAVVSAQLPLDVFDDAA